MAITEEMVEAAANVITNLWSNIDDWDYTLQLAREALEAAEKLRPPQPVALTLPAGVNRPPE